VLFKGFKEMGSTGPYTVNRTCDWLWIYSCEVMDRLSFSPDLAPSNPHYNGDLKFTICYFAINVKLSDGSAVEYTRLYERLKNYTLHTALTSISDNSHSELSFAYIGDKAPAVLPDISRDKLLLQAIQSKVSKSKCTS